MKEDVKSTIQGAGYAIIIILLLVVIHNGNVNSQGKNELRQYEAYEARNRVDIDYSKLKDYADKHEDIAITENNTIEGTPDPYNQVFYNDDSIHDTEYLSSQVQLANESESQNSTNWCITIDISWYGMTVLRKDNGNWIPLASFNCGVGTVDNPTKEGKYTVEHKYAQLGGLSNVLLLGNDVNNSIRISNLYLGYSGQYDKHGNIRLSDTNSRFLYDNIDIGTEVIIHK